MLLKNHWYTGDGPGIESHILKTGDIYMYHTWDNDIYGETRTSNHSLVLVNYVYYKAKVLNSN